MCVAQECCSLTRIQLHATNIFDSRAAVPLSAHKPIMLLHVLGYKRNYVTTSVTFVVTEDLVTEN